MAGEIPRCTHCGMKQSYTPDWTLWPWPDDAALCSSCNDERHTEDEYDGEIEPASTARWTKQLHVIHDEDDPDGGEYYRYSTGEQFTEDLDQILALTGSSLYESLYVDGCWYVRRLEDEA